MFGSEQTAKNSSFKVIRASFKGMLQRLMHDSVPLVTQEGTTMNAYLSPCECFLNPGSRP
jgi:hypothetical protein